MYSTQIYDGLAFLERIANASERIATALEHANDADPLAAIERAMADQGTPERAFLETSDTRPLGDVIVPRGEEWRFR